MEQKQGIMLDVNGFPKGTSILDEEKLRADVAAGVNRDAEDVMTTCGAMKEKYSYARSDSSED